MMKVRSLLVACALGAAIAGGATAANAQVYVQAAPPAPIYEAVPGSPGAGYYWIPGHWRWNGYRYVWIRGHYSYRPYAGAVWRPGRWVYGPNGYYWVEGHWASY